MKNIRLIVNADDCGMSDVVNEDIRKYIEDGLITSTTIMANMSDFDGAVRLYEEYHDKISFGIHFNLTEGEPLSSSQVLQDIGFYVERGNHLCLNGKNISDSLMNKDVKLAILKELECQAEKILDSGIVPSHLDSHEHVHWKKELLPLFCVVARKFGITKMRREFNYGGNPSLKETFRRRAWRWKMFFYNSGLSCTDAFTNLGTFFNEFEKGKLDSGKTYELLCHPGKRGDLFKRQFEMLKLMKQHLYPKIQLISYNQL